MLFRSWGGSGGGALAFGVLIAELSRVSAGVSLTPLVAKLGVIPLVVAGDTEKAERMTRGIAKGEILMSYALTEAEAGSDAGGMQTRYRRDGDSFVLDGTKRFISGAGVSHAYVVFATRDPSAGTAGISAFLVMKDDPGVSFGRKEDKMGVRGSPTREVVLEGCRIPVDRLIGEEGRGFAYAMKTLDQSRPAVGAQAVGIAQGAFDDMATISLSGSVSGDVWTFTVQPGDGTVLGALKTSSSKTVNSPPAASVVTLSPDRKSTRLNSSHIPLSRMPSSA